ncbi:MAG: 2-isopropylmalate synthase, partial [bacterium]|nr:2-isopropylmalate synthase [bacterium]
MQENIKIFDTTLRDGEQAPGFSMNGQEKLRMAHQLEALGVDVIEAGFPAASPEDFESVARIAAELSVPEVCGLARCHPGDIERTLKAIEKAKKPRIHVFIATSDIHLQHKLGISREEAVKKAVESVKLAKQHCDRIDFSPEDAGRSDWNFLVEILTE